MPIFSDTDVEQFITDGYICVRNAFEAEIIQRCQDELWRLLIECEPKLYRNDRGTWVKEHIRLNGSSAQCFVDAANTDRLHKAIDEIVGEGNWKPRRSVGTFPIRFPSENDPDQAGWHIDGSLFVGEPGQEADHTIFPPPYNINLTSDGRAALLLFLFSDQPAPEYGPVKIKRASHRNVPKLLEGKGRCGLHPDDVVSQLDVDHYETVHATGMAGDVYIVHPFAVHSGQANRSDAPRLLGQPEVTPADTPVF
jgi:hypothetical protein